MSAAIAFEDLLLLVIVALAPAAVYLVWVRKAQRSRSPAWGSLVAGFLYGALFATITAGVLELILVSLGTAVSQRYPAPEFVFLNGSSTAGAFFLVLVIAPFIEEALKASGVSARGGSILRIADGPVVGASVGLGFGFFETFLYGVGAYLVGGLAAGISLILIRSISSVLLHGSSTGMFGYGFSRSKFHVPGPGSGGYYLLAVGMHATFNTLASASLLLALLGVSGIAGTVGTYVAFLAAVAFAIGAIEHVRTVAQTADYPALQPRPQTTVVRRPPAQGR